MLCTRTHPQPAELTIRPRLADLLFLNRSFCFDASAGPPPAELPLDGRHRRGRGRAHRRNRARCVDKRAFTVNAAGDKVAVVECRTEPAQCAFVVDRILMAITGKCRSNVFR